MKKSLNMLEGNITELILLFFLPILCGSLFQQLYNTVDAIVVGNFVGKEALAAVGGSTGTVDLGWLGSYTKFVNLERRFDD